MSFFFNGGKPLIRSRSIQNNWTLKLWRPTYKQYKANQLRLCQQKIKDYCGKRGECTYMLNPVSKFPNCTEVRSWSEGRRVTTWESIAKTRTMLNGKELSMKMHDHVIPNRKIFSSLAGLHWVAYIIEQIHYNERARFNNEVL